MGEFRKIKIDLVTQGGETLIYKPIKGDYRQSGKIMNSVYYSLLKEYGIETYKGFGIYYDNPRKVKKEKLRSEAGCILENNEYDLEKLQGKFNIKTFPRKKVPGYNVSL